MKKIILYLMMSSTSFIYSYIASNMLRTTVTDTMREETDCCYIMYPFRLAARDFDIKQLKFVECNNCPYVSEKEKKREKTPTIKIF